MTQGIPTIVALRRLHGLCLAHADRRVTEVPHARDIGAAHRPIRWLLADRGYPGVASTRMRLSRCRAQHAGRHVDSDVKYHRGRRVIGFRVLALPGRDTAMTRLCPLLPRTPFSVDLVARLSRFRWQIDRCFTEGKAYANLHTFATANAHRAEGLIWASLAPRSSHAFSPTRRHAWGHGDVDASRGHGRASHSAMHSSRPWAAVG